MRVDPLIHLNEVIWSVFQTIASFSIVALAVVLVVAVALELRSRMRRPVRKDNVRGRRVATAAR